MILWEVLVPTLFPDGRPIKKSHHNIWDEKVREITGGLTITKPAKGYWEADDGEVIKERMIPVRIGCTEEEIDEVIQLTLDHYEQQAVMAYKMSDNVKMVKASEEQKKEWREKDKLGLYHDYLPNAPDKV